MEESARESRERLRALSDNLPNGLVYQIDSGVDGTERRFTYLSAGVEELHEIPAEAALADPMAIYGQVHEEDRLLVAALEKEAARTFSPLRVEVRVTLPSGRTRHRLFNSAPRRMPDGRIVWDGIEIDTTDHRAAEESLRRSEERYRTVFDEATEGIILMATDGSIVWMNRTFARMHGYAGPEEMKIEHIRSLDAPETARLRPERIGRLLSGEGLDFETEHYHKDGHTFFLSVSARVVEIEGKRFYLGFHQDISERRAAAAEREKLHEQLVHAQKMESVGRLAGGIAHDFNNMLLVILGHAEMALGRLQPDDPLHDDLWRISQAAERSAELTRQLLAFARKQAIAPRVLLLNDVVEKMIRILSRFIGENVDLDWVPGERTGRVKMDPSQIDQILVNLCANARDAISGAGRISIATDRVVLDVAPDASSAGCNPGNYALLTVSDTGCGMDDATLAHIFEPFFTTKDPGKGTGMGLSTVYGIVQQNSGCIRVESEPGRGTVFRIYLPSCVEKPLPGTSAGAAERQAICGSGTILLVEDEAMIRDIACRMLERLGYTVVVAGTPAEAVRIAQGYRADAIDLLVTDVIMPGMNGRELADALLAIHPGMGQLFISGYADNIITSNGVIERALHFLQKPFSMDELAAKVREALASRRLLLFTI